MSLKALENPKYCILQPGKKGKDIKRSLRAKIYYDLTGGETPHTAREESLQEEPTTITEVMSQSVRHRTREKLGERAYSYFAKENSPLQHAPWDCWQPTARPAWQRSTTVYTAS